MKAISVRQPWIWAILFALKRIENRAWLASPGLLAQAVALIGQEILLHASSGCTYEEYLDGCDAIALAKGWGATTAAAMIPQLRDLPRGVLVARARLEDVVRTDKMGHRWSRRDARCALCGSLDTTTTRVTRCHKADPWANLGCIGLILADVEPMANPITYKGRLGFFEVPDEIVRAA